MSQAEEPDLPHMRVSYSQDSLDQPDLAATWYEQLQRWLNDAAMAGFAEPNAMVLATADRRGQPSSRTVLCKGLDARGVVFYTNYRSAKSHDLAASGLASATFPWFAIERQAHVRGSVEKVPAEETAAYWATRPRGSQLGAWASPQSKEVASREVLDAALVQAQQQFAVIDPIPVPEHWGGWLIRPHAVEFWQGRPNRMHDRLAFIQSGDEWLIRRLAP